MSVAQQTTRKSLALPVKPKQGSREIGFQQGFWRLCARKAWLEVTVSIVVLINWRGVRMLALCSARKLATLVLQLASAYRRWTTKSPASLMLSRACEMRESNYRCYFPAQFNGCGAESAVSTVSFG